MAPHLHRQLASALGIPEEQVECGSRLAGDLGLDRFDCLELLDVLEATLGVSIPDDVLGAVVTVGDLERSIAAARDRAAA